jgi:hypothetical protein
LGLFPQAGASTSACANAALHEKSDRLRGHARVSAEVQGIRRRGLPSTPPQCNSYPPPLPALSKANRRCQPQPKTGW